MGKTRSLRNSGCSLAQFPLSQGCQQISRKHDSLRLAPGEDKHGFLDRARGAVLAQRPKTQAA